MSVARYTQADGQTLELMEFALAYEAPMWMCGHQKAFAAAIAWERELLHRNGLNDPYLDWLARIDVVRRLAQIFGAVTVKDIHDLIHRPFPSKGNLP